MRKVVANDDGLRSVAAEITVAIAGVRRDDYDATIEAIKVQLDRFGIEHLKRERVTA